MIRYHARWVVPVTRPPIGDGTVVEDRGRIVYVGPRSHAPDGEDRDLGDAILLPGLVNAHTHLELTVFRGMLEGLSFRDWVATLQRMKTAIMTRERYLDSVNAGIAEGLRAGITTFADTCDSGVALEAMRAMGVRGIMYQEVFGPSPAPDVVEQSAAQLREKLDRLAPLETSLQRLGVSPHAPYTVSDPLFMSTARLGWPMAVHIAESVDESRFVVDADGPFAAAHKARGIPVAPRARSSIALLDRLGVLDARPLLIHAVRLDDADIRRIAASGCAVAHCPVSNAKLGHGIAPVLDLLDAGVAVGLGSDSMVSNDRMHLLEEARAAVLMQRSRAARPDVMSAQTALEMATIGGARSLGLDDRVGSLEPGKDADLTAFDVGALGGAAAFDPVAALIFSLGAAQARCVVVAGQVRVWDHALLDDDPQRAGRLAVIVEEALKQGIGSSE